MNDYEEIEDCEPYVEPETRIKLTHFAYGMTVAHGVFDDDEDGRKAAASVLRRKRRLGYRTKILERGRKWQITNPAGGGLVGDQAGYIELYEQDVS